MHMHENVNKQSDFVTQTNFFFLLQRRAGRLVNLVLLQFSYLPKLITTS